MPPRRSCFCRRLGRHVCAFRSFNATTAFLLRCALRAKLVITYWFQCHHGVPASSGGRMARGTDDPVSMPPRRSCFAAGARR